MEKEVLKKDITCLKVFAETTKTAMYEKFGFGYIGEPQLIGGVYAVMMGKKYK